MKREATKKDSKIDQTSRENVRRNLAFAVEERLSHPKVTIKGGSLIEISKRVSNDIEESCFLASRNGDYYLYQALISEFVAHISPYFKTARHSMLFRDLMVNGKMRNDAGEIPDRINIAKASKEELWPEIYANDYLTPQEKSDILDLRNVEIGMAVLLFQKMVKSDEIILKVDEVSKAQMKVCFGQSNQCWTIAEPQINLPCQQDGTCDVPQLNTCMRYETFLKYFAANGMRGNVPNPSIPDEYLDTATTVRVRRVWSKEIKMTRVYLDIIEAISQ